MLKNKTHITILLLIFLSGCVQKTYKKTIVFELDTKDVKNIKTVGIRGNDKPLNWDYSLEMAPVKKDSIYSLTTTFITGYKFAEAKFTVNDAFELQEKGNRRIYFSEKDTTFYKATFNISK